MKNKKLVSTVVASALVATTMAMPVMAADAGQVEVDVDTKTAVIRVEVPTSLEVAVNQFEKDDDGSQIYSGDFGIKNKSEIPVQLTVDSELKMNAAVKLSGTKAAIESSEEANGEAWLAVAAQTSAGKYIEESGKTTKDLTEGNENVATFVQDATTKTKATAQQVFYLDKAANVASLTYTTYVPKADAKADIAYAQFYKLTPVTFADASDASASQLELDTAIAAGDVYEIVKATDDATPTGQTLTIHKKGTTGVTYGATNTYYEVAPTPTAEADLKTAEKYVYTETAAGGTAAFRYIGKLSESKATWSNTDFEKVTIKYDIVGATNTKYNSVKDDCTYGLYTPVMGPQVTMTSDGVITISNLTADVNYAHSAVLEYGDESDDLDTDSNMEWDTDNWTEEDGGTLVFKLSQAWLDALNGKSATLTVHLTNEETIETNCQF